MDHEHHGKKTAESDKEIGFTVARYIAAGLSNRLEKVNEDIPKLATAPILVLER